MRRSVSGSCLKIFLKSSLRCLYVGLSTCRGSYNPTLFIYYHTPDNPDVVLFERFDSKEVEQKPSLTFWLHFSLPHVKAMLRTNEPKFLWGSSCIVQGPTECIATGWKHWLDLIQKHTLGWSWTSQDDWVDWGTKTFKLIKRWRMV